MRRLIVPLTVLATALFAFSAVPADAGTSGHAAITITSNAGFTTCACVTSGNGTAASPYVIGPWSIAAPSGGTTGWSVKIDNSGGGITDYFDIFGISSTYNDTNTTDPTIWLVDVKTPTLISGNNADPTAGNDLGMGIELDSSANISIDNVNYNKGNGTGVYINGSTNITVNNSKLKATCVICTPHTGDGIYAVNSSGIQIGTGSDCPNTNPCVDVTYDDGMGIWLNNTHDVVINQVSTGANDTGGIVLDGPDTYHVTVQNTQGDGTGNICITFNGQKVNTGYFTDLQGGLHIINGAHDNTITNDEFTADTGISVASGGNGFYVNECTGVTNQPFSPVEAPMGSGNTFSNICYTNTNIASLPPSTCKS
ncbi:MAG TPA: right-handed parallel beta-helix repeat-containing protein [Streptosporangiaceae bacterium]|nr:right-handed parallel beta-helix repeat-containing protein [Streptosporangiaceae bacterium]